MAKLWKWMSEGYHFLIFPYVGYKEVSVKGNPTRATWSRWRGFELSQPVQLEIITITAEKEFQNPIHSIVVMDNDKKNSQPRNAADLFNDIPGFSIQKRSNTSLEPSLRSFKYEQMNVRYNGGDKIVNACPNRHGPLLRRTSFR